MCEAVAGMWTEAQGARHRGAVVNGTRNEQRAERVEKAWTVVKGMRAEGTTKGSESEAVDANADAEARCRCGVR